MELSILQWRILDKFHQNSANLKRSKNLHNICANMKSIGKGIKDLKAVECNNELGLQDEDVKMSATKLAFGKVRMSVAEQEDMHKELNFFLIYKRKFDL